MNTTPHAIHDDRMEWKETARWIKFEEDVEEGGNKWSKPHVATLSLHSLFELRSCLLKGTVILDMQADNLTHISGEEGRERERDDIEHYMFANMAKKVFLYHVEYG